MPLGGSGADMQKSLRDNRSLVHRRKSVQEIYAENSSGKKQGKEYRFKEPTAEEMDALKLRIAKRKQREDTVLAITLLILTGLGALVVVYLS